MSARLSAQMASSSRPSRADGGAAARPTRPRQPVGGVGGRVRRWGWWIGRVGGMGGGVGGVGGGVSGWWAEWAVGWVGGGVGVVKWVGWVGVAACPTRPRQPAGERLSRVRQSSGTFSRLQPWFRTISEARIAPLQLRVLPTGVFRYNAVHNGAALTPGSWRPIKIDQRRRCGETCIGSRRLNTIQNAEWSGPRACLWEADVDQRSAQAVKAARDSADLLSKTVVSCSEIGDSIPYSAEWGGQRACLGQADENGPSADAIEAARGVAGAPCVGRNECITRA